MRVMTDPSDAPSKEQAETIQVSAPPAAAIYANRIPKISLDNAVIISDIAIGKNENAPLKYPLNTPDAQMKAIDGAIASMEAYASSFPIEAANIFDIEKNKTDNIAPKRRNILNDFFTVCSAFSVSPRDKYSEHIIDIDLGIPAVDII